MPALPGAPKPGAPAPASPLPGPGSALDSPASLLTEKGRNWARTPSLPALPPAPSSPSGQDQSVCVGEWARVRLSREISVVVGVWVEVLWSPLPMVWESPVSFLCSSFVYVAAWLAAGICLSVCCPCAYAWGGRRAPPHVALALSMQEPQSPHFVRVF